MSIGLKRLILTALFFGLLPGAALDAQDAPTQENGAGAIASSGGGYRALSGAEAAFFVLPDDVDLVSSRRIERHGLTYERYQQVFGGAKVLGGQLSLYRNDAGDITTVIGAHYPDIVPTNAARLAAAEAHGIVDRDIGPAGQRFTDLMIDPRSGRYFFRVETRRADSRWILWIGAQNGGVLNKYNALMHATHCTNPVLQPTCGFGVEYPDFPSDVKDLTGQTTWSDTYNAYMLWSQDNRRGTYDYGASDIFTIPIAKDLDDVWDLLGTASPAQQAMVDSHYYAYVADKYFGDTYDFDWVLEGMASGMKYDFMAMFAHHNGAGANNAFWNGNNVSLGDGDQVDFRAFTSLDVVTHEITHGVTDFTSDLIYQNESGALNEAFSDIMAAGAEYYADRGGMEPAAGDDDPNSVAPLFIPDFLVGEDIDLRDSEVIPGIRNMGDPEEDSTTLPGPVIVPHPDHYSELYTGSDDNGGVHINSGIPNHAFFLLVYGGQNASCADPITHSSGHCLGGIGDGTSVTGIGLADAEQIAFMAFTSLNSTATLCDARLASEAAALTLTPIAIGLSNAEMAQSTNDAWIAVGLTDLECGLISDPDAPARPTLLSATHDGNGNVDLVWADNADNEDEYRVFRNGAEVGSTAENIEIYTDISVPDGTYSYYVQAHSSTAGT
ncbi:MAG: M4 family metallopeptidase, partial [Alphaproteobacteria bacterium]|nr:M4 family metallopeptidase [Alphaproteobacteria bacterium]